MAKSRKKSKSETTEPVPVSEVLASSHIAEIIEQAKAEQPQIPPPAEPSQVATDKFGDPVAAFEAQRAREQAVTEPEPQTEPEMPGKHAAAVLAGRPKMQPPPAGYYDFASNREAGIRACKAHDHGSVCLQFSDDRPSTREERNLLERVHAIPDGTEYRYESARKIWRRETPPGWTPSENTLDAERTMQQLAAARNEGRGR